MSEPIIRVENLGKKYSIRHEHPERYTALRDVLAQSARKLFSFPKHLRPNPPVSDYEDFWALKDLNFEIQQGDRVGIIGRNGAGKSTLLKILSRITEPTTGRIELNGRVASLLEVGTGFHPELTGRENIFLNGAILGMTRQEIKRNFDEIVDFSGVEQFLDMPVKRYSSGMYVRLAFSVAAHLQPEILIVDEVLAVGDAEFQKKCLGKMEEVSQSSGRTILFVSHNINSINAICNKGIWLNKGSLMSFGNIHSITTSYSNNNTSEIYEQIWETPHAPGDDIVKLLETAIIDKNNTRKYTFHIVEDIGIYFKYEVFQENYTIWLGFNLFDMNGNNLFDSHSITLDTYKEPHKIGTHTAIAWIPKNLLSDGQYSVGIALFNHLTCKIHCHLKSIINFSLIDNGNYGSLTARGVMGNEFPGLIRPLLNWNKSEIK